MFFLVPVLYKSLVITCGALVWYVHFCTKDMWLVQSWLDSLVNWKCSLMMWCVPSSVCVCVSMHTCLVAFFVQVFLCVFPCIFSMHTCVHLWKHALLCVCACVCVCVCVCVRTLVHMRMGRGGMGGLHKACGSFLNTNQQRQMSPFWY